MSGTTVCFRGKEIHTARSASLYLSSVHPMSLSRGTSSVKARPSPLVSYFWYISVNFSLSASVRDMIEETGSARRRYQGTRNLNECRIQTPVSPTLIVCRDGAMRMPSAVGVALHHEGGQPQKFSPSHDSIVRYFRSVQISHASLHTFSR